MAGDPLQRVNPGEPFRPSAATWNEFVEAAKKLKLQGGGFGASMTPVRGPETILVKNNTADDIEVGRVLQLGDDLFDPADDEDVFLYDACIVADTPSGDRTGKFVITAQVIPAGELGLAFADGVCKVRLHGSGTYADVADGVTDYLEAGTSGNARVLWSESGTDERWATVRLNDPKIQPAIRWGVAQADYSAYGNVDVLICEGDKSAPVPVLDANGDQIIVACEAPGIAGQKCTIGDVYPMDGLRDDLLYVFRNTECAPTLDTDSSGNCILGS